MPTQVTEMGEMLLAKLERLGPVDAAVPLHSGKGDGEPSPGANFVGLDAVEGLRIHVHDAAVLPALLLCLGDGLMVNILRER